MRQAFGPYTLGESIAVGGVGELFAAVHADGPRAVKLLHRELAERPELVELFEAEAALARRLRHPNLVRATDSGQIDGRHFIAMELVNGSNIVDYVAPREVAARIGTDLCAALDAVHDAGFAHCDVSPSNVLLTVDGGVKLTDFGVACPLGERQPEVRGTYAYMSPEQAKGEPITRASDVFSLGTVLWELVCGARLFRRKAAYLTIAAVVESAAPPVGDDALDAVLTPALNKNPARRYSSCRELSDALAAL